MTVGARPASGSALPFVVRRGEEVVGPSEIRSTKETIHGLVRLEPDRLVLQWRVDRATDLVGHEIRQDREVGPVQELAIPLDGVAKAAVRNRWWEWRPRLVLTATDLRAFEEAAGQEALRSPHPAQLVLEIRRADRLLAREFAADVTLAAAELLERRRHERLGRGGEDGPSGHDPT